MRIARVVFGALLLSIFLATAGCGFDMLLAVAQEAALAQMTPEERREYERKRQEAWDQKQSEKESRKREKERAKQTRSGDEPAPRPSSPPPQKQ